MPEVLTEVEQLSGRDLDAAIAERVMGWKLVDRRAMGWHPDGGDVWTTGDSENPTYQYFKPSESIQAAMEVVEKLIGPFCRVMTDQGGDRPPCVEVKRLLGGEWVFVARVEAESLLSAICLAALKAVGEE